MRKSLYSENVKETIDFPKKLIFNNLSKKNLDERKLKLENYLNQLSQIINLIDYFEACEFLEIDEHTKVLLSSLDFELKSGSPCHKRSLDDTIIKNRREKKIMPTNAELFRDVIFVYNERW